MSDRPGLRRPRLLWTLLGVMLLVGVVPLLISHYFLIGINRDSLETLEKKYLTRSAVGIANDIENIVTSYTQQLRKIAGGMTISRTLAPAGVDPFTVPAQAGLISTYTTGDPDLLALRIR